MLSPRFIAPGKNIHPRGVYYACVAAGDVRKPDGDLFTGADANASWINEASQLARWLRYVPFKRLPYIIKRLLAEGLERRKSGDRPRQRG